MELSRLWHWERFVPNLGNNLELRPQDQLYLEVAVGLTKVEMAAFNEAITHVDAAALAASAGKLAEAWAPFIRVGPGNHSIDGKPIASLRDYLLGIIHQVGFFNLFELGRAVSRLNSISGSRELFSERPSGGSVSTGGPRTENEGGQTGAR